MQSFRRRRIAIPVDATSLVLDVGSGDKPHWRADVLLDRFPDEAHGGQRSGASAARVDRPLFDADAADMPFADKVFDYAICSHVLEHVEHPDAVVAELTRVAKAGYIEVPEAASAKIVDFPSHLWWVTLDEERAGLHREDTAVLRRRHRPLPHRAVACVNPSPTCSTSTSTIVSSSCRGPTRSPVGSSARRRRS